MNLENFRSMPIIGILRGIDAEMIEPLVDAVISAGLKTLEITMNTKGASALIRKAKDVSGSRITLGAGTVLTMQDLENALENGASFIVMPVLIEDIVKYCLKNKIPVFPGALTPREIYHAWDMGATMVKVFPAKFFGPEYFRQIKGPFNKIKLLACGGVTSENLKDYFLNGADAVTFGASIFRNDWLLNRDFKTICSAVKDFIGSWESFCSLNKSC